MAGDLATLVGELREREIQKQQYLADVIVSLSNILTNALRELDKHDPAAADHLRALLEEKVDLQRGIAILFAR